MFCTLTTWYFSNFKKCRKRLSIKVRWHRCLKIRFHYILIWTFRKWLGRQYEQIYIHLTLNFTINFFLKGTGIQRSTVLKKTSRESRNEGSTVSFLSLLLARFFPTPVITVYDTGYVRVPFLVILRAARFVSSPASSVPVMTSLVETEDTRRVRHTLRCNSTLNTVSVVPSVIR